jgi:small subunit ribosomal protein S7|tara:strand:+ start:224 stop:694 length:471 start_codon:yes stop_codon:yes gene_type:complete
MSRKRKAPKRTFLTDTKYKSNLILKLMNSIMYDGKKTIAEKIVYDALNKLQSKEKEEPIKIFETAINNIKPTIEVRSRRVGGATYQVPVEVKQKRSKALAIRWLINASKKRKDKNMSDKICYELYDAYHGRGLAIKKKEDMHKMAESNKAFAHFRW